MRQALRVSAAAATTLITLAEAKLHLRVDHAEEDDDITARLSAAINAAETQTRQRWRAQVWTIIADDWSEIANLAGYGPCTVTIAYRDTQGAMQALPGTQYAVSAGPVPVLYPTAAAGDAWPATDGRPGAIIVTATVASRSLPEDVRAWVLLLLGALYESRESEVTGTTTSSLQFADSLLDEYRIHVAG